MPKLQRQSHQALKRIVASRMQDVVASKREQNGLSQIAGEMGASFTTIKIKEGVYEYVPRKRSVCHNALLYVEHDLTKPTDGDGQATARYMCFKCRKPCEVK